MSIPRTAAGPGSCDSALDRLRAVPIWSDEAVAGAGLPIEDVSLVTVGGGMASFALVDMLRVSGTPATDITVVSPQRLPYETFRLLARSSQIKDHEPLRSDSSSRVDNIWGFPGYAVERAITDRRLTPLWKVLTEPILAEVYNPSPDQLYRGIDREADRIGWHGMLVAGRVETVRRRRGGGYVSLVRPSDAARPFALRSTHVHLGLGYPALRYAETFTDYRLHHGDYYHVVNAYESHEHVYEVLKRRAGTVVVRGAGIVASRILQRLIDDRARSGRPVRIVHLFRTYTDDPGRGRPARRVGDGWRYQAFNFSKASFAGQLHQRLLKLDPPERAALIRAAGETTTAWRRLWQQQLRRARRAGYYRGIQAEVRDMTPRAGKILLTIAARGQSDHERIEADYVIDCTGLEPDIRRSPVLSDLLAVGGATLNPLGGLEMAPGFEVRGTRSETGRMYASGVIALGGHLAPVDSFFGFSYAALRICDELAGLDFCPRLGVGRSVQAWLKWMTGRSP